MTALAGNLVAADDFHATARLRLGWLNSGASVEVEVAGLQRLARPVMSQSGLPKSQCRSEQKSVQQVPLGQTECWL